MSLVNSQCLAAMHKIPLGSSNKESNQENIRMPCGKYGSDKDGFDGDAEAEQPEDWDEEEDGEWEPPRVTNPKCEDGPGCGEWERPTIPNPNYKGTWYPAMIDNPEYKVSFSCN
jgi:calnexin